MKIAKFAIFRWNVEEERRKERERERERETRKHNQN